MKFRLLSLLATLAASLAAAEPASRVTVTPQSGRVRIEVDGALFTEYIYAGAPKPYLYPVLAADGTRLTRDYPMAETPGEEHDHPHHRSLWFAHGDVNGQDFWTETEKTGHIVHAALLETRSGETGLLRTRNRWVSGDGVEFCADETTIRVCAVPHGRLLDYEIVLRAPSDRPVVLGDTKEGTMALRVAGWMVMTHKVKGRIVEGAGHALNSAGDRDVAAWGKRASWVDYFAPHGGKVYGVAIFDHPDNPRHPTWWHTRDYGLFAANPFGQHDFEGLKDRPRAGELTVPAGGELRFRYRFYFHEGEPADAGVADRYSDYATGRETGAASP